MVNISFQSITQRTRMKRAGTQRERKAERMRHTARMRKTTSAKTANVGSIPPPKKGRHTTPKGTHETHRHMDHETDQRPLHLIFNAGWSGAEASFQILPYFNSLFHNIDFFFMPCRWLHLARFKGQIRTGRKYARLLVKNFQPPGWTD